MEWNGTRKAQTTHDGLRRSLTEQNRADSTDFRPTDDADDTFAEETESPEEVPETNVIEENDGRLFIFKGENKVLRVNRDLVEEDFTNENVILQFFLDKAHPIVWVMADDEEGPTKHLELNVTYAVQAVTQSKFKFRIGGSVRGTPAAA